MVPSYVVGVDGGTESLRAGVFTADGTLVASFASTYDTEFPHVSTSSTLVMRRGTWLFAPSPNPGFLHAAWMGRATARGLVESTGGGCVGSRERIW